MSVTSCSLQASSTSEDRVDPPGSKTCRTPMWWAWSMLSRNGRKPSETSVSSSSWAIHSARGRSSTVGVLVGNRLVSSAQLGWGHVGVSDSDLPVQPVLSGHAVDDR
jgi:hypothetical protein